MADQLDVDAMIARFRERAAAVRDRPLPPVAGPERQRFVDQAQLDFQDFAIIGDATWDFTDGVLTLRVDLGVPAGRGVDPAARAVRPICSSSASFRSRCWRNARSTATQIVFENGYPSVGTRIISGTRIGEQRHHRDVGSGEHERDRRTSR